MKKNFSIFPYQFNSELESVLFQNHRDYLAWPMVYFLNDNNSREAYVGETTDVINRLKTHAKSQRKSKLSSANLIFSDLFNKSATLDIESNLIRYISADGLYELQNGNLGISNHVYFQRKEVYWDLFREIWNELLSMGIARHSLEHIDNSDLFKYSPYKALSSEQISGLKMILQCLLDDSAKTTLINGGAGTGKSILAIFLFKLLKTNLEDFNLSDFEEEDQELFAMVENVKAKYGDLNMALVIPMASFRKTISKVFQNIKGLSAKMVIGPSDMAKKNFDLVIVDEGHRLRRRVNLGPYFKPFDETSARLGLDNQKSSELDWVLLQSKKSIIFYDRFQSIKPSDVTRERFKQLEEDPTTRNETLKSQFRSKGGIDYVKFIHNLMDGNLASLKPFQSYHYDVRLFEDMEQLVNEIRFKEINEGLSRLVAGYAWEWVSKNDKSKYDIVLDGVELQWNSTAVDWINSQSSINEVGCIHTTQGYDLNYAGVIIGPELDFDFGSDSIIVYKNRYKDKAGKNTISDENILKDYILNIYKTILLRGIKGVFVYACNENLRKYLSRYLPIHKPEKQAIELKFVTEPNHRTIPFYNLNVAAGTFSEQQTVQDPVYIELDHEISNQENFFACRVIINHSG